MGCVTSKVLTRSGSFQEELKHSLWRRDNKGFPIPKKGGDRQFLALVYSPESVPKILQSASYSQGSNSDKDTRPFNSINVEAVNPGTKKGSWEELLAGLEETPHTVESPIVEAPKRSKSFDWSREHELSIQGSTIEEDGENRGIERCRSFHTVEEYEKLLKANSHKNCCDVELMKNKSNFSTSESEVRNYCCNSVLPTDFKDESRRADELKEKGSRRKAMAKELTSLQIPSTMELPAIASLKDWVVQVEEQAKSPPGVCDTPNFGSFDLSVSMNTRSNECSGDIGSDSDSNSAFDPDMLSAFEEAMQQLQTEEERVLQLIEDENNSS